MSKRFWISWISVGENGFGKVQDDNVAYTCLLRDSYIYFDTTLFLRSQYYPKKTTLESWYISHGLSPSPESKFSVTTESWPLLSSLVP